MADAYFTLVEGVEVGDTIKKGETVPVKVKISSKDDEIKDNKLKINFNFTQVD